MDKKRSKTSNFSLNLGGNSGNLPSKEEIERNIAKATGKEVEPEKTEPAAPKAKRSRVPFTTALTPELRATLEVAAREENTGVADILQKALEHYFQQVRPIEDTDLRDTFLKLFRK